MESYSGNKIIISLTTIPSRLHVLPIVLKNVVQFAQFIRQIILCIPHYSTRFDTQYRLPRSLQQCISRHSSLITLYRCKDYGPATKLLGCLEYYQHVQKHIDCDIMVIDDDRLMRPQCLPRFCEALTHYPGYLLCGIFRSQVPGTPPVPYGSAGILFPKEVLQRTKSDIFDFHSKMPSMRYVDDVMWKRYFIDAHKIPYHVVGYYFTPELPGTKDKLCEDTVLLRPQLQEKAFQVHV